MLVFSCLAGATGAQICQSGANLGALDKLISAASVTLPQQCVLVRGGGWSPSPRHVSCIGHGGGEGGGEGGSC